MRIKDLIGRIIFWFIKAHLEAWNVALATRRVQFYKSMFKEKREKQVVKDYGIENYQKNRDYL